MVVLQYEGNLTKWQFALIMQNASCCMEWRARDNLQVHHRAKRSLVLVSVSVFSFPAWYNPKKHHTGHNPEILMSSVSDQQSQSPRQHTMTLTRQNMLGTLSLHFEAVFLLGCPSYIHIQWVVMVFKKTIMMKCVLS